jgi:hypothetical protein
VGDPPERAKVDPQTVCAVGGSKSPVKGAGKAFTEREMGFPVKGVTWEPVPALGTRWPTWLGARWLTGGLRA